MYDELIKRLRCQLYGNCPSCVNWYTEEVEPNLWRERCAAIDAADAIEELSRENESLAKSVNEASEILRKRWIPVEEKLPDVGERVLCYCRANIYEIMKMREDGDWVYDANHVYMHSFVTHWMKRPEPPAKVFSENGSFNESVKSGGKE